MSEMDGSPGLHKQIRTINESATWRAEQSQNRVTGQRGGGMLHDQMWKLLLQVSFVRTGRSGLSFAKREEKKDPDRRIHTQLTNNPSPMDSTVLVVEDFANRET